ncbi:transposase IS66 family protein [Clostridium puniceum]|uniref:Transposase IS66 family protein n=1 Tax=Clostridium puniceum TaxID=29367 RepID=A0A1S8T9K0_9CLOT|nr:transposase IS66 family protein [Clostridium puniceum]
MERDISLLYDRLHKEIYNSRVPQADEMPVCVSKDGRPAGAKSYMWIYRTGKMHNAAPIVLYEYQKIRNSSHPREFLKNYSGTVVTDGYQVYHSLEEEREDLRIAVCWSHARRRFANVVKALGKEKAKGTLANDALKQIAAIYKVEGLLSEISSEERQKQRQLTVKTLVEAFFAWVKQHQNAVLPKSETGKGFTYCLNQEKYLKVFQRMEMFRLTIMLTKEVFVASASEDVTGILLIQLMELRPVLLFIVLQKQQKQII